MAGKIVFNNDVIKFMSLFNNVTKVDLKDCIEGPNKIIFIVGTGNAGKAIGKKGINVQKLEKKFGKKVKIIEYNENPIQFIKNTIHPNKVRDIVCENGDTYIITPIDNPTRGMLIGRNAVNLREYEKIIMRYFKFKELKVV